MFENTDLSGSISEIRSLASRSTLARMTLKLFQLWGLSDDDQCLVLRVDSDTLERYRAGAPLDDDLDSLERVGWLMSIHAGLRTIYPYNRGLVYSWISAPNKGLTDGKSPLEIIADPNRDGLREIEHYIGWMLNH